MKRVVLSVCAAVAAAVVAQAETYTWRVGTTGNWEDAANWTVKGGTPERAPSSQDDVILPAPTDAANNYVVTADAAINVGSLTVGSDTAGTDCLATFESKTNGTHRIGGDLVVKAGGKMSHTALPPNANTVAEECYKLNLEVGGDVTVTVYGQMNVTERGYSSMKGPGYTADQNKYRNAAHGGTHYAGKDYGSLFAPTNCGSGVVTSGGGAIRIAAAGTVMVDGAIRSDSSHAGAWNGGAGGSVWISCKELVGSGALSANGGGSSYGGSGCGGRIAVWQTEAADFSKWTGAISAYGGGGNSLGCGCGAAGTIYLQSRGETVRTAKVIVNNGSNGRPPEGESYIELCARNGSDVIGTLVVTNNGGVKVASGVTVDIYCSVSTVGGVGYWQSGTVRLMGTSPATVSGSSAYGNFTCEEPGKTISFGTTASDCFEIASGHTLTLKGSEAELLNLRPAGGASAKWMMKLDAGATADIVYASVLNSDASQGDQAVPAYHSENLGGNKKWAFTVPVVPGETNTWTGVENTDWNEPGNWSLGRAPADTDCLVVPAEDGESAPISNMPVLVAGTTVLNKLTVETGASVVLNGGNITVTNELNVAGTLTAAGRERIVCTKDINFAGGTFIAGSSAFVLEGEGDQAFNPNGQSFAALYIEKNSGTVSFADGLAAAVLDCAATNELTLAFAAEKTVDAASLLLRGWRSDGGQALVLTSSEPGTSWKLKVGNLQSVVGVRVSDSDANAGALALADETSVDAGRNAHWDFGTVSGLKNAMWVGGASGSFSTASKWSSHAVPDANTRVVIFARDGETNTVTASAAISVHDLTVQGEGLAVFESQTAADHVIAGDLVVNAGGKVTHTALTGSMTTISQESYKLNLVVGGSVTVAADGAIDVTSRGFAIRTGPGYHSANNTYGTYAGHAGTHDADGYTYGSMVAPTNCGSGAYTTAGGGVIRLVSAGTVTVDGSVLACSDTANNAGSGSGGSIWITCPRLLGTGTLSVSAGDDAYACAGSGGRLAVWLTEAGNFDDWHGTMLARGGDNTSSAFGAKMASAGTIYLQAAGQGRTNATVIIENGNPKIQTDVGFVELGNKTESDVFGNLIVGSKGVVSAAAKEELTLYGDWTVSGGTCGVTNALLRLAGPELSTISGAQTIDGFVCSDKKKPLCVREGATLRLAADSRVADVDLATDDVTLNVSTNVLTVHTTVHKKGRGWADELDKLVVKEADPDTGKTGDIVWKPQGIAVIIR